jgi:hypothetical protein
MAQVAAFRGAAAIADVVGAIAVGASSFSQSAGGSAITTLTADDRVFSLTVHGGQSGSTLVAPSGFTMVAAGASTSSGITMAMGWASQAKAVAGSVGAATFGFNGSTAQSLGVMVALKPAPLGIINNDTASGAIGLTGTCVDGYTKLVAYVDTPAGVVAFAGSVIESSVISGPRYIDAPTGSLPLTGTLARTGSFTDARTGALPLSGSRIERRGYTDASSGALKLAGTAVDSYATQKVYTDAPTGTIALTRGPGNESLRRLDKPNGTLSVAGTRTESAIYRRFDKPAGRIQLFGRAVQLSLRAPYPVGIPGEAAVATLLGPTVTLLPPTGSGYAVGDVLLCFTTNEPGAHLQDTDPPGWTRLLNLSSQQTGGNAQLVIFARVAESVVEPAPTIVWDTPANNTVAYAQVTAFRGLSQNLSTITDVIGAPSIVTFSHYYALMAGGQQITTLADYDLVLSLAQEDGGSAIVPVPPPDFSLVGPPTKANYGSLTAAWAYQIKHPAGVVPAPIFTVEGDPDWDTLGVMIALKPVPVEAQTSAPSGRLPLAGTCIAKHVYPDRPAVGVIKLLGSIKTETSVGKSKPTGTFALSGSVAETWKHAGQCGGTIRLSGQASEGYSYSDTLTSTIPVTGTASDDYHIFVGDDKPIGRLTFTGVIVGWHGGEDSANGIVKLGGIKSEFITIEGAIFYDDFPGGLLILNGRAVFVDYTPEPGRDGRIVTAFGAGRVVRSLDTGRAVGNLTGRLT